MRCTGFFHVYNSDRTERVLLLFSTECKLILRTYPTVCLFTGIIILTLLLPTAGEFPGYADPAGFTVLPILLFFPVFNTQLSRSGEEHLLYRLTGGDIRQILYMKNICSLLPTLIFSLSTVLIFRMIHPHHPLDLHRSCIMGASIALTALTRGNLQSLHSIRQSFTVRIPLFHAMRIVLLPLALVAMCSSLVLQISKCMYMILLMTLVLHTAVLHCTKTVKVDRQKEAND